MKTAKKGIVLCGLLSASVQLDAALPLFGTGLNTHTQSNSVLDRIDDYTIEPKAVKIGDTGRLLADVAIDPTTQRFYSVSLSNPTSALYELNPTEGGAALIQAFSTNMPGQLGMISKCQEMSNFHEQICLPKYRRPWITVTKSERQGNRP